MYSVLCDIIRQGFIQTYREEVEGGGGGGGGGRGKVVGGRGKVVVGWEEMHWGSKPHPHMHTYIYYHNTATLRGG